MASTAHPQRYPKVLSPFNKNVWLTPATYYDVNKTKTSLEKSKEEQQRLFDVAKNNITLLGYDKARWKELQQEDPTNPAYEEGLRNTEKEIVSEKSKLAKANDKLTKLNTDYEALKKKYSTNSAPSFNTSNGNSTGTGTTDGTLKPPFSYKYNAPMVSSAYILNRLSPDGDYNNPQVESTPNDKLITSPGQYKDAKTDAWQSGEDGIGGSKGVIQMSQFLAQKTKITSDAKKQAFFSTQMYGFKFLYNPTTVSMSWGVNTEVNTQMESMGLDKSVPLTGGLFGSTINFDLLLNRIGDMGHLDEFGLKAPNQGNVSDRNNAKSPYPTTVNPDDLKLIYKKGTMYDIEYLFKAINGFNAEYKSDLNGLTADRGWLYALPVELHLGNGLKYLVRITSLNVNHNMFNERMVPILTTVSLGCSRFYDGAEQTYEKSSK
jgi:hypothetical protein